MRLYIAEKPSLGRAIAQVALKGSSAIAGNSGPVGLSGAGATVTWVFGHILEQAPPEHYDARYKKWDAADLPIKVDKWALLPSNAEQLGVIRKLLKDASEVVHAGDPDREGQLLVDEVLDFLGWRGKTLRLLPHATDPDSMKKALASMQDNARFKPLYEAALCRQRADWLVGMNASRAATLLLTTHRQMVPVGRVMTPTLALVVRRDALVENFAEQPFYRLALALKSPGGEHFTLLHDPAERIFDKAVAISLLQAAKKAAGQRVAVSCVKTKVTERAPLPWHLGDFQRATQKRLGLPLKASLEVLQGLYEKGLVSYPRTDCRYLPKEQQGAAVGILDKALDVLGDEKADAVRALRSTWKAKDYIYDNAKVAEHHGIIPTGKAPSGLDDKSLGAYRLIVEHFAKTMLPHHEVGQTSLQWAHDDVVFSATAKRSLNEARSWRVLEPFGDKAALPEVADGSLCDVLSWDVQEGKTTPPPRYTEATLSADMEAVAKYVTDERIKAKLKETSGIGTAATRSATIEKLKAKGFLALQGRGKTQELISTPFGREVIAAMPSLLSDAGMTALWEDALSEVAAARMDAGEFMAKTDRMVASIVDRFRASTARITATPTVAVRSQSAAQSKSASKGASAGKSAPRGSFKARSAPVSLRKKG